MILKPASSIPEQLVLLRKRGMIIDCEDFAAAFLESNHYYRLNIYFHNLMVSRDLFPAGTRFSQVAAIYGNDQWLRNKILSILEPIEIKIRTQISHYLGIHYGSDAFYRNEIYKIQMIHQQILGHFSIEVKRNPSDPVIKHHQINYDGLFPIWVVVEFLSFNSLSKYYSNLLEKDKKVIARNSYRINEYILGQWMHVLSVLRNICAHYGPLYCREYPLRQRLSENLGGTLV